MIFWTFPWHHLFRPFFSVVRLFSCSLFILFLNQILFDLICVPFVFRFPVKLFETFSSLPDCESVMFYLSRFYAWLLTAFELRVSTLSLCCLVLGLCFFFIRTTFNVQIIVMCLLHVPLALTALALTPTSLYPRCFMTTRCTEQKCC